MNAQLSFEQCEQLRILTLEDEASKVAALEDELAHVKMQLIESIEKYATLVIRVRVTLDNVKRNLLQNAGQWEVCS